MKKLVSLLLVLLLAVSLFACGGNEETPVTKLVSLIDASEPTRVTSLVTYMDADENTYTGAFTTDIEGENFILTYSYQRMALIEEMAETPIVTESGTVYYKDGKYSTDGKTWTSEAPAAVTQNLNVDEALFATCRVNDDGNTLFATVTGENIEKVFGTAIEAEGAVSLRIDTNGTHLTAMSVNYDSANGGYVEVRTSYTYGPVTLDFPSAD